MSERQLDRLEAGLEAGDPDYEVTVAWSCYQKLRAAAVTDLRAGQRIALEVLDNHRLRMLLIGGGLTSASSSKQSRISRANMVRLG